MSGCFLPQDDQVLAPVPPQRNRPPRIVVPFPGELRTTSGNQEPDCPPLVFSAWVEDRDLSDLITVRWYIDPNGDETLPDRPYSESKILPSDTVIRGTKTEEKIKVTGSSPLATAGMHIVELLISDGTLINREPQPLSRPGAPDGGMYQDSSYTDSYMWRVEITNGAQECGQ